MVLCRMNSDVKRYLTLGVFAVLAGVLLVSFAPGFAPEELLTPPETERNGSEAVSAVSAQPRDVLLLLLLPLALAGVSYSIVRKTA